MTLEGEAKPKNVSKVLLFEIAVIKVSWLDLHCKANRHTKPQALELPPKSEGGRKRYG